MFDKVMHVLGILGLGLLLGLTLTALDFYTNDTCSGTSNALEVCETEAEYNGLGATDGFIPQPVCSCMVRGVEVGFLAWSQTFEE